MNAPTLAFLSQVRGNLALSNTHFTVVVDDGITRAEVYNTSENYLWKNNWVDMSAWAGKEVTIRFVVYQSTGEPLIQVDLDDISLGAG